MLWDHLCHLGPSAFTLCSHSGFCFPLYFFWDGSLMAGKIIALCPILGCGWKNGKYGLLEWMYKFLLFQPWNTEKTETLHLPLPNNSSLSALNQGMGIPISLILGIIHLSFGSTAGFSGSQHSPRELWDLSRITIPLVSRSCMFQVNKPLLFPNPTATEWDGITLLISWMNTRDDLSDELSSALCSLLRFPRTSPYLQENFSPFSTESQVLTSRHRS